MGSLSVVLVHWNRCEATLACVERMSRWERPSPLIWIVDNGPSDRCAARLRRRFPRAAVLACGRNLGFGAGNNRALERIGEDDVLLLNDDAAIEEESVRRLQRTLEQDPSIGIVGPLVLAAGGEGQVLSAGGRDILRHVRTNRRKAASLEEPYQVDYVPGTAALLRRRLLLEVGLLDERFFFGGEMADLARRAREAGWSSVIEPRAQARHDVKAAGELRRTLYPYYILRNRFLYLRKHQNGLGRLWAFPWIAYGLLAAARSLATARWARARAELLGLGHGLIGRFGGQNERFLP